MGWQIFQGALQALAVVGGHGQRFGIFSFGRHGLFVELRHFLGYVILLQPGEAAITDDLQKPGARVAGLKPSEGPVSAQEGVLGDVFGLRAPTQYPARQIVSGVLLLHIALTATRLSLFPPGANFLKKIVGWVAGIKPRVVRSCTVNTSTGGALLGSSQRARATFKSWAVRELRRSGAG
jgi:hypothetical protein